MSAQQKLPERLLRITRFSSKRELFYVMCDAVEAHENIMNNPSEQACEISMNNIMFNVEEGSSRVSKESTAEEPNFNPWKIHQGYYINSLEDIEPQDILPFKSCDELKHASLEKFVRRAHHDLESFFYIVLWICVHYKRPFVKKVSTTCLQDWHREDKSKMWLGTYKHKVMLDRELFEEHILDNFQPYFDEMKPCMRRLRMSFFLEKTKMTHKSMITLLKRGVDALEII